jgi:hypothetical protein
LLFDSVFAGCDVEGALAIDLRSHTYRIETAGFETEGVWFVAHRFVKRAIL